MILADYDRVAQALISKASTIARAKRPGYTRGDGDVLHNFKTVANRLGISPMQAWGVYFLKHIDAINALAKDPTIPQAEEISGRFCDAINYLQLGYALHTEHTRSTDNRGDVKAGAEPLQEVDRSGPTEDVLDGRDDEPILVSLSESVQEAPQSARTDGGRTGKTCDHPSTLAKMVYADGKWKERCGLCGGKTA